MGFWNALGKGLGLGLGVGTGLAITNAAFGGFSPVFGGGCFGDYGYSANQFCRMDAYMQGRFDQAYVDRMQLAALYYGRGAWGC
jgi:hypothetical protein